MVIVLVCNVLFPQSVLYGAIGCIFPKAVVGRFWWQWRFATLSEYIDALIFLEQWSCSRTMVTLLGVYRACLQYTLMMVQVLHSLPSLLLTTALCAPLCGSIRGLNGSHLTAGCILSVSGLCVPVL